MVGKPQIVRFIAPNQCAIITDEGTYFQSYDSICAFRGINGKVTLYEDWSYSRTTLKYLKVFLKTSASKAELQKKLDNGTFIKG